MDELALVIAESKHPYLCYLALRAASVESISIHRQEECAARTSARATQVS